MAHYATMDYPAKSPIKIQDALLGKGSYYLNRGTEGERSRYMRKSKIVYNPLLSVKENAENNRVSEAAIRWYIRTNGIDRKRDNAIIIQRAIKDIKKKCPDISIKELSDELHLSINTIKKHLNTDVQLSDNDSSKLSTFDTSTKKFLISTISDNQHEILNNILRLHVKRKQFDCDLTYSVGVFYKHLPQPLLKYDEYPQMEGVLPLKAAYDIEANKLHSIVIDLPFIIRNNKGGDSINACKIANRFNSFQTPQELYDANDSILSLAFDKLERRGLLIVKTMDVIFAGKQHWVANYVINKATELGFEMVDLFILIAKGKLIRSDGCIQHHARKFHSYFLIFQKR